MFGMLRPCRHDLPGELFGAWQGQLCGLCLSLRDEHGQLARAATNYDGILLAVLTQAQAQSGSDSRRAGPCPLRGMRTARVAVGAGVQHAATVSLALAAGSIEDHLADGDLTGPVRGRLAGGLAGRFAAGAARAATAERFDTAAVTAVGPAQQAIEAGADATTTILDITAPTEAATAAAFVHTAVLAGRPENIVPLREAGRLFGRLAHLLDAVEDRADDGRLGRFNPILLTDAGPPEVRRLCDDAVTGIRLAAAELTLTDRTLLDVLLGPVLTKAVRRSFRAAGIGPAGRGHAGGCGASTGPGGGGPEPDLPAQWPQGKRAREQARADVPRVRWYKPLDWCCPVSVDNRGRLRRRCQLDCCDCGGAGNCCSGRGGGRGGGGSGCCDDCCDCDCCCP